VFCYCRGAPVQRVDPRGTDSGGSASEGSVLTGTIDPILDKKGFGYNTEVKLEITLKDGSKVIRRADRFFQDSRGDWIAIEAKGEKPQNLTVNERLADKKIQEQGARFRVLVSAGTPPPGHGQFRMDIPFTVNFVGEIKRGNFHYVHGNASHQATDTDPAMASAGLWKGFMESIYRDAAAHDGMIRKINPNAAPTWITFEQFRAEYKKNTGREFPTGVSNATGYMTVAPKAGFLSHSQFHPSLWKQIAIGTGLAGVVFTSPLWVPALVRATPTAARGGARANLVRVAIEEVGGVRVRIVEDQALEYINEIGTEGGQQLKRAILNPE